MELGARVHSLSSKWCYQFCCATKMPTASEARELDAYGDRSNRSLGRTPGTAYPDPLHNGLH